MARLIKGRFEYRPGMHRPKTKRNGAIFILGVLALVAFMYTGGTIPLLPKGGEVIKAEFSSAANVTTKTPVRVRGVDVGKVEKVERRPGGRGVVVTMRIEDGKGVDLRQDARADILWRTLLGFAFYIQLEPGAEEEKLSATIPMDRTTTQVELDQVLADVDRPSREGVQEILAEFETGFDQGSDAGDVVDRLAPAMRNVAPALDGFRGTESGDLTDLVRDGSRLMGALARNERELGEVVKNANTTLAVTAAQRASLGTLFREGPSTLDETRTTMARVRTTLGVLDPIAEKLRPGARDIDDASVALRPALRRLDPLLNTAKPALRDLSPAVRRLGVAAKEGSTLIARLDPTVDRVNETIIPGLNKKNPETDLEVFQAIGPALATVASSASQFDRNGYVQRFTAVTPNEESFSDLPCKANLIAGSLDCSDIQYAVGSLLGLNAPPGAIGGGRDDAVLTPSPTKRRRSKTAAARKNTDSAGSRGDLNDATDVLNNLVDVVGGIL